MPHDRYSGNGRFDLIVCRHALFHNTNSAIRAILEAFNASGAAWLAATTLMPLPGGHESTTTGAEVRQAGTG